MSKLSKEEEAAIEAEIDLVAEACEKDWIRKYGTNKSAFGKELNFRVMACNKLINEEAHKIVEGLET